MVTTGVRLVGRLSRSGITRSTPYPSGQRHPPGRLTPTGGRLLPGGWRPAAADTLQRIMNQTENQTSGPRVAAIVAGALVGLIGFALLAGGGALLWGDAKKGDDGYLSSAKHRFAASSYAIVSGGM